MFTKKKMELTIKANYQVVLNGVDKNKFTPSNIKKEDIITFVGNLKRRKGLLFLLETITKVKTIRPDISVIVIGDIDVNHKDYTKISNYIKKNNLNIIFAGKVSEDQLIKFYQKAKLNILPSQTEPLYFEGFGLVHAEANACGTLTIGTLNSGNEDAISIDNGYLVHYGDTQELCNKILEVFTFDKYPTINYLSIQDWKDVGKNYENIFENLLRENKNQGCQK